MSFEGEWKLVQESGHPVRSEKVEVWSRVSSRGRFLGLLLLPLSFAVTFLWLLFWIVVQVLLYVPRRCVRRFPNPLLPMEEAWRGGAGWFLASLTACGGNLVRVHRDGRFVAELETQYGILSGQNPNRVEALWHPELPVLVVGLKDDIYFDRIVLDLKGEKKGATGGLENRYRWRGARFIGVGFTLGHFIPRPEDQDLVEWAKSAVKSSGRGRFKRAVC